MDVQAIICPSCSARQQLQPPSHPHIMKQQSTGGYTMKTDIMDFRKFYF